MSFALYPGEVLAIVSLPDYDANDFRTAPADDRFDRAVTGMYEPGSTFKLQTASMALDGGIGTVGVAHDHPMFIGDDVGHPLKGFTTKSSDRS